jgi:membrane-bound lytic murein transglycosylase D
MNLLIKRIWLLPALALVLDGCGSSETAVKPEETLGYQSYTPPESQSTAPPQNYRRYKPLSQPRKYTSSQIGEFEKPAELAPAVDFWRKTYVEWSRSEASIHDDRYLDVVYEVMEIPGYVGESLTSEQKDMVRQRREYWQARLSALENKVRYNVALDDNERDLIDKLQAGGKTIEGFLYGAAERVRSQRGTRERFMKGLEISRQYERQFRKIFRDAGLPDDLALLPHVESSFQPSAKSSAGAIGMWQFTKGAAKTFMPGKRVDLCLDPIASTVGAANYLSYAYNKLGDWPTAITSYNHGIGGMKRAQNTVGRDFVRIVKAYHGPAFGFASRNYYAQFLAALEITNNPEQ